MAQVHRGQTLHFPFFIKRQQVSAETTSLYREVVIYLKRFNEWSLCRHAQLTFQEFHFHGERLDEGSAVNLVLPTDKLSRERLITSSRTKERPAYQFAAANPPIASVRRRHTTKEIVHILSRRGRSTTSKTCSDCNSS